jgi:hypothetical protein
MMKPPPPFAEWSERDAPEPPEVLALEAVDALMYLQSIYRDPQHPQSTRMRAAGMALPYERAKLSAVMHKHYGMADRMEAMHAERQLAPQSTAVTLEARRVEDGG